MKNPMKTRLLVAAFAVLTMTTTTAQTPRENLDLKRADQLFNSICRPQSTPVSFVYDGKIYHGLGRLSMTDQQTRTEGVVATTELHFQLDKQVEVRLVASKNKEYGEVEYALWFENTGSEPSGVLEQVKVADLDFKGAQPLLRGCLGDHQNQYAAYEKDLLKEPVNFRSDGGRATHVVFPYFDLVHGNGGTLMALGWAGTWQADFTTHAPSSKNISQGEGTSSSPSGFLPLGKRGDGRGVLGGGSTTHFSAASCNDFRSVLMPGERVRTALVVMLPYQGRNYDDATNLWREWFVKYNMPCYDATGKRIQPFSTTAFAADTGLPNSDGSISERFYTWRRTLDRILYEKVKVDFRWFDAGWYFDPSGHTVPSNWWGTVGSWELDTIKWPGKTLRESNEACHRAGMKVLTWFEPERVTQVDALVRNYGYQKEWAISNGRGVITNDIGNEDCRQWTLRRITRMMKDNAIDLFREDNNSDPGTTWPLQDQRQQELTGLPRTGITENKAIQGHYQLWDEIISFCAANDKLTFIDNCASGGGRNDIESLRRSIPFMRSDADRTTTALRLSMSSTFNRWIPFHGSATKESDNELDAGPKGGNSEYVIRASWLPVYNLAACFTHDETLDYDRLRRTMAEWQRFRHLLVEEFYVLTPWHSQHDTSGWTAFAYRDRHTDESVVLLFRQETCEEPTFTACLPYAVSGTKYHLANVDTGETLTMTGDDLRQKGFSVSLGEPKTCSVWHVTTGDMPDKSDKDREEEVADATSEDVGLPVSEKVYDVVEVMPQFPGGNLAMMQWISENIRYPEDAPCSMGRVVVSFVVGKDGSISDAQVVRSVGKEHDAEALRVVKAMPKWKPGFQEGKPVPVRYQLPVAFP